MAHDVKTRFHSTLPGRGQDLNGSPVQGKTRVVGLIDVTSSNGSAGEALDAIALGLTAIDSIVLRPVDEIPDNRDGTIKREAVYSLNTSRFYLVDIDATGARTFVSQGSALGIEFTAEGDSSANVELT